MLHETDQMGWLTVRTGATHGFAIKRLDVQDFALRADHGTVWFCHDCNGAGVVGHSLLQCSDIHRSEGAPQR